jgi:RNA polymerase sigma-70 factor (ECF subfamily)
MTETRVPSTDRQLDEERFNRIVRDNRAALLSYARRLTGGDHGRAEDVLQEAFLRAWHNLERLTPERGSVGGWLRRVVHNLVVDGHRTRQSRPTELELAPEHDDLAAQPDHAESVLLATMMEEALQLVWPVQRDALVEVYLNDRTTAQAAAALGVPVGTVKSRVYYGLRTLRRDAGQTLGTADRPGRPGRPPVAADQPRPPGQPRRPARRPATTQAPDRTLPRAG